MALYQIKAPDGNTYRIEGPDGATQDDVIRAVVAQHPYAGFTTEELKKQPSAPMSAGDIGRAGLSSLVGAAGSIASAFGAESAPARGLRGLAQEIQQGMTPERQEEMRRREEIMSRAEKEGTLSEVGSGVGAVTEAPLQAVASGLGSSVPAIVAGVGAIVAGAPFAIAGAVALTAKLAVGALQGAGEAKGSIFESVTQKLMEEKGLSRTEAEAQAIKAQEYLGKNAPGIMGSAAAGILDAVLGVESMFGKAGKKAATRPLTQPSMLKTAGTTALGEAVPEAIQAGVGQVAENVALQNAGIDTSTFQGVSGAVARDALMGALTGGAVSPLQMSSLRKEYAQEKERRLNEEQAKIDEQIRKEEEALRQQQEAVAAQERAKEEEMVAAPPVEVKAPKNVHPIRNPLGNIEKEDLQQEGIDPYLSQHIDEYRKSAGLPPIQSYSIEDIVDSMPGVNPVEEQQQIDTLLAARTGYSGERLTAKDVLDQAEAKQIPIDQSFSDFLNRTTGQADPKSMSQAQLFAAFKSIQALPEKAELETGSNAIRFTDKQYNAAIKSLDKKLGEEPVLVSEALSDIKLSTGLSEDMYAKSILDEAVRRGDVDRAGEKITAPTTAEVLPKGYKIQEGMFERGEKPEGFQIQMGDMVLPEVYDSQEEATRRSQEYVKGQGNLVRNINNAIKQNESTLQKAEDKLSEMQLAGKTGIEYDKAQATVSKLRVKVAENIDRLNKQLEKVDPEKAPISVIQAKARKVKGKGFTLFKDNKSVNVFKAREEAERAIVEGLPEEEIQALTQAKGRRTLKKRAEEEITRRTQPKAPEAKPEKKPEFEPTLRALLDRFGLKDVALKIEKDMKADGEYSKAVIKVALDSANPVRTLRHESIHALKELGFFTPQQWKALENAAKTKWIDTYLKGRNINGEPLEAGQQSRYDAYMNVYKGDQDAIIEEAIADAFGDFDMTKAPPGLMTAILKRLKLFFEALRNALTGAGFQTYEDVFGKVERGALEPVAAPAEAGVKLSLGKVPLSTRAIMEMDDKSAREALGLKTEAVKNVFNNVRDIALALNNETVNSDGKMDRLNLTGEDQGRIANAIADEVEYQLSTTAKTGTGLGWYSSNYPNAVKRLGNRFPELKTNKHARSVFSALVAVTSNGERVATNIKNAIELYSKLRDGKKLVGVGSRRATALENNLQVIQDLLAEHGTDFEKVLLREITVKDMNAALREMGEEPDGSYLADTVVPAAAVYFGPKLGAFYANLSGSEGYLTMDLWWTRSINRMRGLLQPQATEASINKFRDMMDRPDASREEVISATIPLRNKYEEYGWTTELEHLAGEKEPAKKEQKSKWFKRAEKDAGPAYEQLLFEHNLEKMANTIYKNEYEMLEEAPFTATDRKFMYDAARDAQTMLRKRGIDLTLADIQAALWYYEKRLYQKLSGRKADDIGYEEAIIAQSGETGGRVKPSVVFGAEPSGRAEPGAEVAEAPAVREAGREPTGKLSLREAPSFDMSDLPPPSEGKFVLKEGTRIYHGAHRARAEEIKAAGQKLLARPPYKSGGGMMDEGNLIWFGGKDLAEGHSKSEIDTLRAKYDEEKGLLRMEGDVFSALTDKDYSLVNRGKILTKEEANTLNNALQLPDYKKVKAGDALWQAAQRAHDVSPVVDKWQVGSSGTMTDSLAKSLTALGYDGLYDGSGIALVAKEGIDIGQTPMKRYSLRDTPQFKNWFGDSKIVNEDGTPKVMYHGTARDITVFKPKQANAIFVTEDPKFAEVFGDASEGYMVGEFFNKATPEKRNQIIMKAAQRALDEGNITKIEFDRIKREFKEMDVTFGLIPTSIELDIRDIINDELPSRANIMPVYVSAQNPFDYDNSEHVEKLAKQHGGFSDFIRGDISRGAWDTIEDKNIQKSIRAAGFDGFYVKEGGRKNLAVYNPEQIKSATGNSGMYDKYNPDIRYNLRDSTPADIRAAVDRVTTARDDRTHAERITSALKDDDTWSQTRAESLNRYNRFGDYDKELVRQMGGAKLMANLSAEAAALMSDLGAGLTASALGVHDRLGGIPVYKNGVTTVTNLNGTVKGPVAIFAPLSKYGNPYIYQLYQFWAGAERGKRLMANGKEHVYTTDDFTRAKVLEKMYPEFVEIKKEWVKYNNGLVQFLVDTGVLSKDKADEFTRYSDYVPFYRQFDGEQTIGPNLFASISGVRGPKKLKGGEAPLADFLETIVRNTQSSIQMGIKNVAAQRAADVATQIGQATRLDHVASGPEIFTAIENGKLVYYQSHDQLFINAIKSLNLPDLPFIGLLAAPANWLRNLVTKDPAFMLANMVRDSMSAYVTSGANFKPVVSTLANFGKAIAGTSPEYQALLNAGIIGGYEFSQNVEQSSKTMEEAMRIKAGIKSGKDYALGIWQALEKGTTASDAATRMEVYKNTLAETGNEAEALFRALEVMNFNRKGSSAVIRVLTAAIPFLNARMQGLDVLYRAAIRPTVKKLGGKYVTDEETARQRTFVVRGLTIAALSCMYWALTHDDDEYKKQEQEVRDNYWLVPSLGVKIPIPFEVGILFKVIPERIMAYSFGDDTGKDFAKSMGRQLSSTLAFNPIPQTALPLVETITNYSFFTGRDVIPQGLKDVAPEFQVGPGTSLFAQWLGQGIGASPMKIDHLVKGYTGTMGGYLVDMLDMVMDLNNDSPKVSKRLEQMPFIKRFALDPEARGTVTAFYEMKDSVDEVTRTINLLERTGNYEAWGEYYQDNMNMLATKDYIQDLEKQMKELREMKNMIRNSSMSGDEKRDAILDITKMENQLTANMQQLKKLTAK